MSATETAARIKALHQWYCETMGTPLPLNSGTEMLWAYWLKEGYNGPQLRKVIVYLRKEIRAQKRNPGALKLRNLLDPDLFGEDLLLAGHNLSAENKVPKLPDDEGRAVAAAPPSGSVRPPSPAPDTFHTPAAQQALAELQALKRSLKP